MNATIRGLLERYKQLAHAIQSGIVFRKDQTDMEPKHLRTGIDLTKVDHAALVRLLMHKGIFTEEEYYNALVESAEREVDMVRAEIAAEHGIDPDKVHLA